VYSSILEQLESPKQLTIEQRELIIRNGLGDREPNVRSAAEKLISDWCDALEGALPFLSLFDLYESKEAEQALLCVLKSRTDILDSLDFGG
jgi:condensin complex subunit 3